MKRPAIAWTGVALALGVLCLVWLATGFNILVLRHYDQWRGLGLSNEAVPSAAVLNDPSGLWVDSTGRLFFSERRAHVVRSLIEGRLEIIAGVGRKGFTGDGILARDSRLNYPEGLAGDPFGNIYVADSMNHRIRRIQPDGKIETVAGTGEPGFSGDGGPARNARLDRPMDVAVGPSGTLYICDWGNHRVRKISRDGNILTVAGTGQPGFGGDGGPADQALLNGPYGIWVDGEERVLIADSANHRIRRIDAEGMISTIGGTGEAGFSGDGQPAKDAQFDSPQAVFVTSAGSVLVNDEHNHRIREILPQGTVRAVAGTGQADLCGDGGPATQACLYDPEDIMQGASGELYLTDGDNHRIRVIDSSGVIHAVVGSGPIGRKKQ